MSQHFSNDDNKYVNFAEKIKTVNVSRRHFVKMVGAVAGAAALAPLLSACGANPSTGNSGPAPAAGAAGGTAGVVIKKGEPLVAMFSTLDNDYYKMWNAGAEQAVKALEMKFEVYIDDNKPEVIISNFENKTSQGIRMMFITTPGAAPVANIARTAEESQTYFTNTWNMPDWSTPIDFGDYYVTFFTPNSIQAGYNMAKALFEAMGGKGNILQVSGFPGHTADWQRTVGLKMALKEYPNIKVLDSQPGNWNRIDSRRVTENMLTAYPNVNGIFAQNDDEGIGAMQALEERGIKIPIVGADGNKETMEFIKAGRFTASVSSFPFWQAGYSAVRTFDAYHGWKPTIPERMMFTDGLVIDKNNVEQYYNKFYGQEQIPLDWKLMSRVLYPEDWDPQNLLWPLDPEEMWGAEVPKPKDYKENEQVKLAKEAGEFDKIKQLYADHYKKKIL